VAGGGRDPRNGWRCEWITSIWQGRGGGGVLGIQGYHLTWLFGGKGRGGEGGVRWVLYGYGTQLGGARAVAERQLAAREYSAWGDQGGRGGGRLVKGSAYIEAMGKDKKRGNGKGLHFYLDWRAGGGVTEGDVGVVGSPGEWARGQAGGRWRPIWVVGGEFRNPFLLLIGGLGKGEIGVELRA